MLGGGSARLGMCATPRLRLCAAVRWNAVRQRGRSGKGLLRGVTGPVVGSWHFMPRPDLDLSHSVCTPWTRRALLSGLGGSGLALVAGAGCAPAKAPTNAPGAPVGESGHHDELLQEYRALQGFTQKAPKVDAAERAQRRQRFAQAMHANKVDLFVAEAGTQMEFLTGVRWGLSERPVLVWLDKAGTLQFLAPHFEAEKLRAKLEALGDPLPTIHRWREHESVAAVFARIQAGKVVTVGVDPWMRTFVAGPLQASAGKVGNADEVVVQARARKTAVEISRMAWANRATKAAIEKASANLHWGMPQSHFAAHLRAAQEAAGLTRIWVLSLFGPNASFPHGTAQDRKLQAGDVVLVDTGGALHGYQSDVSRTFALGPVAKEVERAARAVHAAQQAAIDAVAVGKRCGEIDAAARQTMRERGYGGADRWFTHRLGHGIGVQVHEAPYLVAHSTQRLDDGMSFSVEPGIYVPGVFGVRIEDIVVATPEGARILGPRCSMEDFYLG